MLAFLVTAVCFSLKQEVTTFKQEGNVLSYKLTLAQRIVIDMAQIQIPAN